MKLKTVVIIGSNGQLGTDLVKVLANESAYKLFQLTHKDVDVTDVSKMNGIFGKIQPDVVINTTAYHNVDEIEVNPQKAFAVNCIALHHMTRLCNAYSALLVFISTDYVFGLDKMRKTPYRESDLPGPVNMYGVSKLAGEYVIREQAKRYLIVRTSGLFGTAGPSGKGKNFVEMMISLAQQNRPIRVVNDQITSPTYTYNLAQQIKILLSNNLQGLYHASAEGECSWFNFAQKIFSYLGKTVKIEPVPSTVIQTKAKRPKYSVLDNSKLHATKYYIMQKWTVGLRDYLIEKAYI